MATLFDITLLFLLVAVAIAIVRVRDLFATVMLTGIYGLLSASFFVSLDAVDVAFTEAAVGAGIFPLLMLAVISVVGRYEKTPHRRPLISLALVTLTGIMLFLGTLDMPPFGAPDDPAQQHVAVRYIQDSPTEIGIPNMVTSVLASYRGYDTLGEVVVIFTAAIGVLAMLAIPLTRSNAESDAPEANMRNHEILRIVSKMLIPLILLFALYVQFHGEYGPGGGFQAGVIFAAEIILYTMLFGLRTATRVINPDVLRLLAALGVLLYGCVGVVSMISGGNFLDYNVLFDNPITGQHMGILFIELGVGITVASTMILMFFAFAGKTENHREDNPW